MDNKSIFSSKNIRWIGILAVLIAGWIILQNGFGPLFRKAALLNRKMRVAQKQRAQQKTILQQAEKMQNERKFCNTGPAENQGAEFLAELQKTLPGFGLATTSAQAQVVAQQPYPRLEIRLALSGELKSLLGLVTAVQAAPYYFKVEELLLQKGNTAAGLQGEVVLSRLAVGENSFKAPDCPALQVALPDGKNAPLLKKDIFISADELAAKIGQGPAGKKSEPKKSGLENFKLVAIIRDAKPQAVIENRQTGQTVFLGVGDFLENAVVEKITRGKVVLQQGTQKTELVF